MKRTDRPRTRAVLTWLRLARVVQKVEHAAAEHLQEWDLNLAQFDILAHVEAAEGMVQQELADSLLVTKGNVCQLLNRLEQHELVERRQEGRVNRLFLTQSGQQLCAEVVPVHQERITALFSALSSEEQVQLLRLLQKLDRSLGRKQ